MMAFEQTIACVCEQAIEGWHHPVKVFLTLPADPDVSQEATFDQLFALAFDTLGVMHVQVDIRKPASAASTCGTAFPAAPLRERMLNQPMLVSAGDD